MGDFDYGREHRLWGDDGIPYGLDREDSYHRSSSRRPRSSTKEKEIQYYVELMQNHNINTIVEMNKYISKQKLWKHFSSIKRENVFSSGFRSIGISKEAYSAVLELYATEDVITSRLVKQNMI